MEVLGVGFLRTGTTSLSMALERLGLGPCYHMRVVNNHPPLAAEWLSAMRAPHATDWDTLLAGYQSAVGSPAASVWPDLIAHYPDTKVILTVRDADAWYDSAEQTIVEGLASPTLVTRLLTGRKRDIGEDDLNLLQQIVHQREGGQTFADRAHAVAAFESHVAQVRAAIPSEQLLVFDVREGWEPLCAFLDVAAPAEPFPHANDRETFRSRQRAARNECMRHRLLPPVAVATSIGASVMGWLAWRRRR